MPIIATDVQYDEGLDRAAVAAILFADWPAAEPSGLYVRFHHGLHDYQPGEFFRRELPCIVPLLQELLANHTIEAIIVDGYVDLGPGRPGMGRHLFYALEERAAVVGVAKTPFFGAPGMAVHRGTSKNPLFVTATGDVSAAAEAISAMHGRFRIPTMLKWVDSMARRGEILKNAPQSG